MVTLILALCIPVTAYVTGFFVIKGVKVGMGLEEPETVYKEQEKPKEEQENPIPAIFNEWLNGKGKEGE